MVLLTSSAAALEEPLYDVLATNEAFEIRRYEPYLVAEVTLSGEFEDTGNNAFRILANYIFGGNVQDEKMSMTAPVESEPDNGMQMSMTAPVLSSAAAATTGSAFTYSFVMERKYSLETLPAPNDPRIRIVERRPGIVAVHRYSGRWTKKNYEENEAQLLDSLRTAGIDTRSAPRLARYNSPLRPPFMRRNEVQVEVNWN